MNSDEDTEKTVSGEETVENSPIEKPQKRKYTKKASATPTINQKHSTPTIDTNKFLIHPKLGKLPKKKTGETDANGEEIYCICRKPDNGDLMIGCDGCDDWYHFKCVKIAFKYQQLVASYFCPYCEAEGKGSTLWKRKCRLPTCFKPISGNESKYCSKEHGLQFLKNVLNQRLPSQNKEDGALEKAQLNELIKHSGNLESFRHLGETFPEPTDIDYDEDSKVKEIINTLEDLKNQRELHANRKKLVIKARENIDKLNESLRALDVTASNSKKRPKKIEVCGFDPAFRDKDAPYLTEDGLSSGDTEFLKTQYNKLQENETISGTRICLNEKKKCARHNGWQSTINDEIDLEIENLALKAAKLEKRKAKLIKTIKIDYFESQKKIPSDQDQVI